LEYQNAIKLTNVNSLIMVYTVNPKNDTNNYYLSDYQLNK